MFLAAVVKSDGASDEDSYDDSALFHAEGSAVGPLSRAEEGSR